MDVTLTPAELIGQPQGNHNLATTLHQRPWLPPRLLFKQGAFFDLNIWGRQLEALDRPHAPTGRRRRGVAFGRLPRGACEPPHPVMPDTEPPLDVTRVSPQGRAGCVE